MSNDPPIACTLSAAELPKRLAEMRAIGDDALTSAVRDGRRSVLTFEASAGTRQRLVAVVEAESSCCAFLTLTLVDGAAGLELTIEAPEGGEPVMQDLVDAFRGGTQVAA